MDKELELLDSKNQIEDLNLEEIEDLDTLKEKYKSLEVQAKDYEGKNRQLYERTKKSEGDLKELKAHADNSDKKPKAEKSDEQLLKRLDSMALKMAGIEATDEKELFTKWKDNTGREADEVIGNKIFQAELADIRQAKANAAATDIKGGDGKDTGEKGTPEYWIAKATKDSTGELLLPDDMPKDYKLYAAIFDKLAAQGKGQDKKFYNSK